MDTILEFGHKLLEMNIKKSDVTIDMTVGNGNDTLLLVNISKYVYGFDIQSIACEKAKELLYEYNNYEIINDTHLNFDKFVKEEFTGVIFNLGYLPGGNKSIHTEALIVLETLKKVLKKIKKTGIVVIVFYPGHTSGLEEEILLSKYLKQINQKEFDVLRYEFINQVNNPPFLIAIKKKV